MIDAIQHKEETARKIKHLRKTKGWSQQQMANRLWGNIPGKNQTHRSRLASYEGGKIIIPFKVISEVCKACGVTLDHFETFNLPTQKQKA